MRFSSVSIDDLKTLQGSLNLLRSIYDDTEFFPYLYAYVTDGEVPSKIGESVSGAEALPPVAVAVPLSVDTLKLLLGSGIRLHGEDAAYMSPDEGARLVELQDHPMLYLNEIKSFALSSDSVWLSEFLESQVPKNISNTKEVKREELIDKAELQPAPSSKNNLSHLDKTSNVEGFDKILMANQTQGSLEITELIEMTDFITSHSKPTNKYLYATHLGHVWLIFTTNPKMGGQHLFQTLRTKYKIKNPVVNVLSGDEVFNMFNQGFVD